jgi:hypothetical protein
VTLLLIALLGQALVQKLGWLANPHGAFRRVVGIVFILVGLIVILGIDKNIQTFILDQGWYDPVAAVEELLRPR